jgi:monomeric sarcosine oxidase
MRVAVLGAGAMGSAAARFLAGAGAGVTIFERFVADHDRGSSFGSSRIIRRVYPDRYYAALMDAAYPLWEELERETGEDLFLHAGGLFFGPEGSVEIAAVLDALDANGVPFRRLSAEETRRRFPAFRLRPGEIGVFQEDGGLLRASACVLAQLRLAERSGAVLRERSPVMRIDPGDEIVLTLENDERFVADRLIVAAGPWMRPLLAPCIDLPLIVTRQVYCHFEPRANPGSFHASAFPIWIDFGANVYGFPQQPGVPGVKVASHNLGRATTPDRVDRVVHESDRDALRAYCAERLPDLSEDVSLEKVCLYTNTPDEDFILDRLPGHPNVVLAGGGSGHAFKFSILLGKIAASLALGETVPWDLSRFRISRFQSP